LLLFLFFIQQGGFFAMNKVLIFGAALALVCGAGLMGVSVAQDDTGAEFLKIEARSGDSSVENPAYFPHRDHQEWLKDFKDNNGRTGCAICHHGKKDDNTQLQYAELPDDQKPKSGEFHCSNCHNKSADGISLEGKVPGLSPIQRAGHGRCQGCHKDQKSTRGTALMPCPTCHVMYKNKVQ
jgi:hypothetical protein